MHCAICRARAIDHIDGAVVSLGPFLLVGGVGAAPFLVFHFFLVFLGIFHRETTDPAAEMDVSVEKPLWPDRRLVMEPL